MSVGEIEHAIAVLKAAIAADEAAQTLYQDALSEARAKASIKATAATARQDAADGLLLAVERTARLS
jgi:hypothetical protein